jgi:hypothetical protein
MRNEEWLQMLRLIPESQQNQIVIMLQNGVDLVVETIFRLESNYLVMRGRRGGDVDENRAFFVPYSQMLCFRLERVVKLNELYALFGETAPESANEDRLAEATEKTKTEAAAQQALLASAQQSAPTMHTGAAAVASPGLADSNAVKNNLLERIRAARATTNQSNRNNTQ